MSKQVYEKFKIERSDGKPIPEDARFFVLRLDKDPAAVAALIEYLRFVELYDPQFSKELESIADDSFKKVFAHAENLPDGHEIQKYSFFPLQELDICYQMMKDRQV